MGEGQIIYYQTQSPAIETNHAIGYTQRVVGVAMSKPAFSPMNLSHPQFVTVLES